MNRLGVVLGVAMLLLAVATPAAAHTRASSATNFESRIEHAPTLAGVTWRLYSGGEFLEVVNDSAVPLVVLGYDGEPYLRVGPGGVERNRNSPATYLNLERYGDVAVPPRADPAAAPEWETMSRTPRHAWQDHRVHWMSPALPPPVAADPGAPRQVGAWVVPFAYGGRSFELTGTLRWDPGPPWWPWLLAGSVLTLAGGFRRRGPAALRPAAVVVAAVSLANLAHLPDEVAALPLPALDVAFGILHNVLFIGAGLAGATLTLGRRTTSLLPLGIGSGAVLFHQGLLQVPQLGASQLATVWPPALVRMLVVLSIAQAIWVAAVIVSILRDQPGRADNGTFVPAEPAPSASSNAQRRVGVPATRSVP